MLPITHVVVSGSLSAAIWFFTKSFNAAILCLASGILLDFDHIVEYVIHYGWKDFSLRNVYDISRETDKKDSPRRFTKLYLIFHSCEVVILLWLSTLLTKNIYVLAVALGYTSHLAMDCVGNPVHPATYFLLWRAAKRFYTDRLLK